MVNFEDLTVYYILVSILLSVYIYRMDKARGNVGFSLLGIAIGIMIPIVPELIKTIRPGVLLLPTSMGLALSGIVVLWCISRQRCFLIRPIARDMALKSIKEGVLIVDRKGRVVDHNSALEGHIKDIIGMEVHITGKIIEDLLKYWPQWYFFCKNMQEGEVIIPSLCYSDRRYHVRVKPIIKGGVKGGTISLISDITNYNSLKEEATLHTELSRDQLKEIVAKLSTQKKQLEVLNSLKDKLFAVITHDIRDPLTAVISLTEILEEEKEQYSSDIVEIIDAVKEYILDTYELIEHLFDWVKSQSFGLIHSPSQLKLSTTIEGVLKLYRIHADAKGITIKSNINEDILVFADKEMLEIVLRNLLSNAIKFTEMGGSITLDGKVAGMAVIISVSDTGIGIHREKVKELFDEAHSSSTTGTTGEKGTGIGLLICREFVRLNGGEIWVETDAGEGSTFYFSVPNL